MSSRNKEDHNLQSFVEVDMLIGLKPIDLFIEVYFYLFFKFQSLKNVRVHPHLHPTLSKVKITITIRMPKPTVAAFISS